jgi:uncharacterized protein (DUF58 family)
VVRLPRHVSPAAARRRGLLIDGLVGVAIGLVAIFLAAGIGVVGFFALLCVLAVALWYLVELGLRRSTARRRRPARLRPGTRPRRTERAGR